MMKFSVPFATTVWFMLATTTFLVNIANGDSKPQWCTETEILEGTCLDACTCPCGNGLGVLIGPNMEGLDCDKPESVCMDPVLAYDLVSYDNGTWCVHLSG